MGVSLNGGTPKTHQNTPKWSFFSRKTHGCWVPPFKETPICLSPNSIQSAGHVDVCWRWYEWNMAHGMPCYHRKPSFALYSFFLDIGSIEYNEVAFCLKPSSKSGLVKRSFIHSFVHKLCFFKPSLFPPFCRGQAFSRFEPGVPRPSRSVCPTFPPADRGGVWRLPFWICLTLRILGPSKLASFWDPRPLLLYRLKKPFQDP